MESETYESWMFYDAVAGTTKIRFLWHSVVVVGCRRRVTDRSCHSISNNSFDFIIFGETTRDMRASNAQEQEHLVVHKSETRQNRTASVDDNIMFGKGSISNEKRHITIMHECAAYEFM